jgi:hypothetical protein
VDVSETVGRRGKEMKHGAVVPHIVDRGLQFDFSDVGGKPMDTLWGFPKTLLIRVNGGLRNIEDGDVFVSVGKEIIDQCGLATPTSMTEAEIPAAAFSIRASEVSRWGRYQLTAFEAFSV